VSAEPACVQAWSLAEGDVLAAGETVLVVQREPLAGTVMILSDDGSRRCFGRGERVVVVGRAGGDGRPVWRVPGFVAGLLPGRPARPLPGAGVAPAWAWVGPGAS
jgi:hypothetical protein